MESSTITDFGRNYIVDRLLNGDSVTEQTTIAVGSGTKPASPSDTSLASKEFETDFSDPDTNVYQAPNEIGTYRINVVISGGVEIDPGTDVTEFGLKTANGDLVYRETRSATTMGAGDRIGFEIDIQFVNA